jgi:hypothetical protein
MKPELPFLAAGAVAVAGGAIKDRVWPSYTGRAVIGTVALVIVASATTETRAAPLVHAIGLLLLLTTIMAAVRAAQKK